MASIIRVLSLTLFFAFLLFAHPTFSADSPESSPSPSPRDISQPPATPSPSPALPVSPPAPPPSDLAPTSPSPAPSPRDDGDASSEHQKSPSPSLSPPVPGDVSHDDQSSAVDTKDESSGGMSGKKKVGIALGVIAAACIVGLGALVYKKRQQNIRRSQYSYAARREFL